MTSGPVECELLITTNNQKDQSMHWGGLIKREKRDATNSRHPKTLETATDHHASVEDVLIGRIGAVSRGRLPIGKECLNQGGQGLDYGRLQYPEGHHILGYPCIIRNILILCGSCIFAERFRDLIPVNRCPFAALEPLWVFWVFLWPERRC